MFEDDNELSGFITTIINTPVRVSGVRLLSFIPKGKELTPFQTIILDIINDLDGIGGRAIDNLKSLLDSAGD